MNILCDYHHSDLWWSLHLILEVELGHKLFRPRGMEWYERSYYDRYSAAVAKQFLGDSILLADYQKYPGFRASLPNPMEPGMLMSPETTWGCPNYPFMRSLTLEEFADAPIDVIMPTLTNNQEPWLRLRNELKPKAKLVREEGNIIGWANLHPAYRNLLTSDLPTYKRARVPNKVLYHQKFDTQRIFYYREPQQFDQITCFMPGFRGVPDLVAFVEKHNFGSMNFVDYGHLSPRGFLSPKTRLAEEMARTAFVWHVKPGGDGFGHIIHNSFAMGRPVITALEDYAESQVRSLLVDGKTCILIGKDPKSNSEKIRAYQDPAKIIEMSHAARDRFRETINYEFEAAQIRAFFERLM